MKFNALLEMQIKTCEGAYAIVQNSYLITLFYEYHSMNSFIYWFAHLSVIEFECKSIFCAIFSIIKWSYAHVKYVLRIDKIEKFSSSCCTRTQPHIFHSVHNHTAVTVAIAAKFVFKSCECYKCLILGNTCTFDMFTSLLVCMQISIPCAHTRKLSSSLLMI